jgi:hypothetical protein
MGGLGYIISGFFLRGFRGLRLASGVLGADCGRGMLRGAILRLSKNDVAMIELGNRGFLIAASKFIGMSFQRWARSRGKFWSKPLAFQRKFIVAGGGGFAQ